MNGTAHKFGGLLAGIWMSYAMHLTIPMAIIVMLISIMGASIPDIDRILPFFTHRGFMHTPVGAALFTIVFKLILITLNTTIVLEIAFLVGYISHLIMDTFTCMGIMWFYPISKKRLRINFRGVKWK